MEEEEEEEEEGGGGGGYELCPHHFHDVAI